MERPTVVTILGILNIVFGVIGVLSLGASAAITLGMDTANPVYVVMQRAPIYKIWTMFSLLIGMIASFALIGAGLGLLQGKAWARKLSIVYALYAIVVGVFAIGMNYVFLLMPLLEGAKTSDPASVGALSGAIGGTVGACFGFIYPVALLYFLRRPNVLEYFGAPPASQAEG